MDSHHQVAKKELLEILHHVKKRAEKNKRHNWAEPIADALDLAQQLDDDASKWTSFEKKWVDKTKQQWSKFGLELCRKAFIHDPYLAKEVKLYGGTPLVVGDSIPSSKTSDLPCLKLSPPNFKGTISLEETLVLRRSAMNFHPLKSITESQLSQILWAALGVTKTDIDGDTYLTVPSAGAMQPLNLYLIVGNVDNVPCGAYQYHNKDHTIAMLNEGDHRDLVSRLSCDQAWMKSAPVIFIITGQWERSAKKYGPAGKQYTIIEVGHVGQNIFLQSVALNLKCAIIGAFQEDNIVKTLNCNPDHVPYSIMPVGYKSDLSK